MRVTRLRPVYVCVCARDTPRGAPSTKRPCVYAFAHVVVAFVAVPAEAALKLTGWGVREYFSIGWNRFDFFLVVTSYLGFFTSVPSFTSVIRVFRVLRAVRLVRRSKKMFQVQPSRP